MGSDKKGLFGDSVEFGDPEWGLPFVVKCSGVSQVQGG